MIQRIKTSKSAKVVSCYLALQLVVSMIYPSQLFALTGGPAQPEFNTFSPIGTSDMVSLSNGDFSYNIPIMDVGGYPLNLSYGSGITMDQEASWVGLGWNMNVGQINRQVRGIPDDFDGDELRYQNNMRTNFTAGIDTGIRFPIFGFDFLNLDVGLGIKYNNYDGFTPNTNFGASFDISDQVSAGLNITSTAGDGVSVTPTVGFTSKKKEVDDFIFSSFTSSLGVPFDSRQGVKGLNMSTSLNRFVGIYNKEKKDFDFVQQTSSGNVSGSLSFNDNLLFNPKNELNFFNANLTINFGLGTEIFGSEGPQGHVTGFGSIQKLRNVDKDKKVKGYGYAHTENASPLNSVLDFNRENDKTVSKNTTMLPVTNQTYDLYSIQAQGVGGMFRAHRNQVGFVFDQTTTSFGIGASTGGEIGPGLGTHLGANIKVNPSFSRSGLWLDGTNTALSNFILNNQSSNPAYEPVYYKLVGELNADSEPNYFNELKGKSPMKIGIGGSKFNRKTKNNYRVKNYGSNNSINYTTENLSGAKRDQRVYRNSSLQMITKAQMDLLPDGQIRTNTLPSNVPKNHQVGIKVLKEDGSTYIFGETAYNTKKVEATFAVNGTGNCLTGLVGYTPGNENSTNNSSGRDHYFNRIETPSYAHSYLLTSVLSKDYEDLTNDGPTDDDLGTYTRFDYAAPTQYKWRVPFQQNKATFSEGFNTNDGDDKGNYVYGEKELKYIETIETKTHIAVFHKSFRKDGHGVAGENGSNGSSSSKMVKLDKISLYSKPEYLADPANAIPIKSAHFEYKYDLCKNVPNNFSGALTSNEISNNGGKLTLDRLYFTHRDSNMGEYTPYIFNYEGLNPDYHLKGYDVWGGYKPATGDCNMGSGLATASEFPFVQQEDKALQDSYVSAWSLTSISLPSGGTLEMEYESDDYGYVQDKSAMQMFKVVGAGTSNNSIQGQQLYSGNSEERNYLYVKVPNGTTTNQFLDKYLRDIGNSDRNPMYFKFMLNMTNSTDDHDYVSGYALVDNKIPGNGVNVFSQGGNTYGAILLKDVKREGGIINSNQKVNPIAKAGWYFGRKNLNRQVYGVDAPNIDEPSDLLDLALSFKNSIGAIGEIFTGPNKALRNKGCAKFFNPERSWIRLYHPDNNKLGGGCRVKSIQMHDNWDAMTDNPGDIFYKNFYGQEYSYLNEQGSTSGVATFEPNGSKENPLVLPFYDKPQKLIAPKESNYVEKPIGQSLYPSPSVTYGRVTVKNLKRERNDNGTPVVLKKHATGEVINEFYTTKDFPTISDYTDITPRVDVTGILGSILKVRTGKSLTYSQGFSIQTNDMNGKTKSQTVKAEGQSNNEFISKVEYKYAVNQLGQLDNNLKVINEDGTISTTQLGVTQDVINDFRSSTSESTVLGANGNLGAIFVFLGLIPVPTILPVVQRHEEELKTAVTTKLIHTTGILKEKIVYDLGSRVSTRNVAWDGQTGNILLTETINEYDDNFYNLEYPSYWHYKNMSAASKNINFNGILEQVGSGDFNRIKDTNGNTVTNILTLGDQLIVSEPVGGSVNVSRLWVAQINASGQVKLIDDTGTLISGFTTNTSFFVYQSGYKNLQMGTMASVTTQFSPISGGQINQAANWQSLDVVSASALEFNDAWDSQCEFRLPDSKNILNKEGNLVDVDNLSFNPFLYNVKNEWRNVKSYSYLGGRNNGTQSYNPREEGFFESYMPFYKRSVNQWVIDSTNWKCSSVITQFSPYGMEIENKDALNRYSAAQYGYRYTLPTAVGSNTEYKEMAFDGFEDYDFVPLNGNSTNPINPHFGYFDEVIANNNATITETTSHSGRNSLQINPRGSATVRHRLIDCDSINGQSKTEVKDVTTQNSIKEQLQEGPRGDIINKE